VQIYLNSTIFDYWGQASFGSRRLCSMTLPVVVGLAALAWRMGRLLVRVPVAARHAIAVVLLAPFIAWNLDRVFHYGKGRAAPDGLQPTCCEYAPKWLQRPLGAAYDLIGNPFQFPASAIFAIRHGVELQRWDRAVGNYPVMPAFDQLSGRKLRGVGGRWRVGYPGTEPYLIGRWTGPRDGDRWFRWTMDREVRVLVPNILPNDQHINIWVAPAGAKHVTLRWNDNVIFDGDLREGWQAIGATIYEPRVGENELTIESELAVYTPPKSDKPVNATAHPVGIAISSIDFSVL